ncbi:hypothetical protein BDR26DRAFT_197933 [Obelidium mucronatum]|nr:hypothetical protein BDR26DRAFT_197933 [Obelidium mucronatum]
MHQELILFPATSMQTNISRLVYIYFKSRHIATIPPLYSLAQSRILEKIFMLLECSFEYESGILSSLSVTLLEVMRLVCDKPESFDENLVVEKVLDSAVVVARGSDEVVFKELVSLLKQASSGNSSNKNRNLQILAVKNLLRLFRFALVERNSLGSDVVFSAISDLSGDTKDVSVEVRAKCIDFLLSLRVLNGENVGISCSLELSEWLGFNKPMILKSSKLRAQSHSDSDTFSSSKIDTEMVTIDLNAYFTSLLRILKLDASWELYSLVIYNFHSQLKNVAVASHLISSSCVESMRAHFCEVVVSEIVAISVTNFPPNTRKSDLYLLVFKFLMTILLWDNQFSKSQTDDVLKCFLLGLTKWPTTARYCIQSLTLLLTELPSPMTRLVPELLMKVSRLTSASMAPSILEFLSTLARLPEIYVNLNEADYKRIFGIALGNIRAGSGGGVLGEYTVQLGYHVLSVWFVNMNVADRRKYVPFIIGHIVGDGGASGGTPGNGGGAGGGSSRAVDESVELVMDMLLQNSYADCAARPDAFEGEGATEAGGDGMASGVGFGVTPSTASKDLVERSWIQGNSVLSIRNLKMSGWVEVTVRRPSGTIVFSMKLENRARFTEDSDGMGAQIPAVVEKTATEVAVLASPDDDSNIFSFDQELDRQKTMASLPRTKPHLKSASSMKSIFHLESKSLPMDPSFILLQLSPYPPQALEAPCIPLPTNEEAFTRAIKVLDRTPVSDLHKIGVLYVGPSQNHELQILRNDSGSRSYTCFMCALGRLVRLKGLKKYNTGGLDTSEACVDGQNCLVWQDASSGNQIVFHTTTLMPTNEQTDPQCSLKKRHVGNDFVSVLFDESGGDEIGFDTLPGQFNFVNILVKPMGTVGFMKGANVMEGAIGGEGAGQSGLFLKEYEDQMFRVVMRVKPELNLPPLGLFSDDGFLVSGANLAGVVRRAAVHANMLALVVAQTRAGGGGFISNARERLRQIKRLADRAKKGITATPLTSGSQVEEMLDFTRFA